MLIDLVRKNRSYRGYDHSRKVTEEELLSLVEAARLCPSSVNVQPLKYFLAFEEPAVSIIQSETKWARGLPELTLPHPGKEPTAFIVICQDISIDANLSRYQKDVGIVAQTMLLAAVETGLGGCMIGNFNAGSVQAVLKLDEHIKPLLIVAIGKPDEEVILADVVDGNTNYYRDEQDRHYVPKREAGDIVISGRQYFGQVVPVNEDTWRIENDMVRCFVLKGTEKALLIDSGMTLRHAKETAAALTGLPVILLNTHADGDHTGCNDEFESFYMHPADEAQYSTSGKGGRIIPVQDGDEIDLGSRKLRIIHLPGHTPGSIAVLDACRRVLISGDPIQEHGRIFMFGEHRNMADYISSLEKLEKMTDSFDEIWPSHADLPLSPDSIPKLREGAKKILDKEIQGYEEEFFGRKIMVYDLGFTTFLCDE